MELGEIENIIEKNKNVKQAIVVKRKLKTGHDVLVAYYTTRESEKIEFKHELENELPQYMIPQYFVKLGKMPYTQNGKIDRKNLPEPNFENREKKIINARNEIDIELIKIIEKMLQIKNVSISDTYWN